jgi:hypothetical protein
MPPAPFEHFCSICGKFGAFGSGVNLCAGEEGVWHCLEHSPNRPRNAERQSEAEQRISSQPLPLLPSASANWTNEDRRRRLEERSIIAMRSGLSRAAAEMAIEFCVVEWLNVHPDPSPPGRCAWCSKPDSPGAVSAPFGTAPGTHAWLHPECWPAWQQARKANAIAALRAIGHSAMNSGTVGMGDSANRTANDASKES